MGKATALKWLLLAAVVLGGLWYWVTWSFDMNTQVANQASTIGERDKTIEDLRAEIQAYTANKTQNKKWFDALEEAQVDLLCAARTNTQVAVPAEPVVQIKEVIQYRDRLSQCPTTDITKAEPFDPTVSVLRPVNDEIALQALNNAWKAYCIATKNEDETCAPFR
ncbi:hypothetical protein D3C76_25530 [compost metagenome]